MTLLVKNPPLDVRLFWNILLLCTISISSVFSHPQCLDFRPPFSSITPPLSFCSEYSNFGCCDRKRDLALKERHSTILESLCTRGDQPERLPVICVDHLRQLICSECSSYAAHIFEAESFQDARRSFPGLCEKFVSQLLPLCRNMLPFFADDPKILNILKNHHSPKRDSSKDQINYFQCKQNQSKSYGADDRWSMKNGNRETADDQMTHPSMIAREQFTKPDHNESSEDLALIKSFFEFVRLKDETYCFPELLVNPKLVLPGVEAPLVEGQSSTGECVCLKRFAGGLRNPVLLVSPDDSTGRLFIAEQIGRVHVFLATGTRLAAPFLDLTRLVTVSSRFADERGLLGMTFHPKFRNNGRFFVFYTVKGGGDQRSSRELIRISEFVSDRRNTNRANASSERSLLEIVNPYWNHNGGAV